MRAMRAALPPQLQVFVRDWLSANNILLRSRDGHVLVDTGYSQHAPLTLSLLATHRGIADEPLARIVNTHCHSDHMGGNAALAERYQCPIAIPEGECPLIERWDTKELLLDYADQTADRFRPDDALFPSMKYVWGDLEWRAIAAPGHDMAALVFYNPEHRILISGDALWQYGFGFVMPPQIDGAALRATRATIEMLASLDVRLVIPGHGEPFTDISRALDRAMQRVVAFEADPLRMARHAMKVVFTFKLLECQRMPRADLAGYFSRVGIYRDFNAIFFRMAPAKFAEWLVEGLLKSHAIELDGDDVVPATRTAVAG
jgi:glyoxylase-like metal-dependent hydrolase (beta-lactamase superfamily II)